MRGRSAADAICVNAIPVMHPINAADGFFIMPKTLFDKVPQAGPPNVVRTTEVEIFQPLVAFTVQWLSH